jgi:hypothetical protein
MIVKVKGHITTGTWLLSGLLNPQVVSLGLHRVGHNLSGDSLVQVVGGLKCLVSSRKTHHL